MYKNKIIIPSTIFQTSINKPEQHVIDKIMSKCKNYTYIHFNDAEIIEFFRNNYINHLIVNKIIYPCEHDRSAVQPVFRYKNR